MNLSAGPMVNGAPYSPRSHRVINARRALTNSGVLGRSFLPVSGPSGEYLRARLVRRWAWRMIR